MFYVLSGIGGVFLGFLIASLIAIRKVTELEEIIETLLVQNEHLKMDNRRKMEEQKLREQVQKEDCSI